VDFSQVTETLFIGTTPPSEAYPFLRGMGVQLVINMRIERPPFRDRSNPPLRLLWLPTADTPLLPIPVRALMRGTVAALETFAQGGKVYTHCKGGVHRGVAMGAAILIAQGHSPEEAMALIKQRREAADPYACISEQICFAEYWGKA
jgi:dual specificity MAP kinase phosphatase